MMTEEEIKALETEVETLRASVDDLTAERDSLAEENNTLKTTLAAAQDETKKTKQLNFTLARQLDARPKESFEDSLLSLVKRG